MKISVYSANNDTTPSVMKTDAASDVKHGRIPNAPKSMAESETQIDEVSSRYKRRSIKLGEDDQKALEQKLFTMLRDWTESNASLNQKLMDWNDLFEGVTQQSDFPWPGASQVHIPLPKVKAREISSTINRSVMRPIPFLTTRYAGPADLYEQSKRSVQDIENFVEDKIKNDTNIWRTLKEAIPAIFRDGTVPLQIMWETEWETVTDFKVYDSIQDFVEDYPSANDAGISKSRYNEIISTLKSGKNYEIEYEYDLATYDAPKAYIVPLYDFVHWPVYVPEIKDKMLHGKRVWFTDYQLDEKVHSGEFEAEDVDRIKATAGEDHTEDFITIARDNIEGINRSVDGIRAPEYQCFELVYKGALTEKDQENGTVKKYLIKYHYLSKTIARIEPYPIRKGAICYFPLRFIKRDNRFLGQSLLDDISDLSSEVDTIHRQRINSRTITHVPSFKAKMTAKATFDPSRREFRFRPGVTFYMNDVMDVQQFDIRPVDLSGSVDDEMLLFQLIDMTTGSSSGLSGQANPIDPRAPARKQQELLRQSSNRIDDYVQNLIDNFSDIGQFIVDMYYQFAPDRLTYYATQEDGSVIEKEMDRNKLFNPSLKFKVTGQSVFENAQLEYSRMQEIYQIIGTDPITSSNPRIRLEALTRLLMAARIDNDKAFLPTQQELPQAFTTDEAAQRESDMTATREKLLAKLGDGAEKRNHQIQMEMLKHENALRETIVNAATQPPEPQEPGQPPQGAPQSGGLGGFPVAPVLPAGIGPGGPPAA